MKKTSDELIHEKLSELIAEVTERFYTEEFKQKPGFKTRRTELATLGMIISKFTEWDGNEIEEIAQAAFEDSNYHRAKVLPEPLFIKQIMQELGITASYDTAVPEKWLHYMEAQGWDRQELYNSTVWLYDKQGGVFGRPFNFMAAWGVKLNGGRGKS